MCLYSKNKLYNTIKKMFYGSLNVLLLQVVQSNDDYINKLKNNGVKNNYTML